MLLSIDKVLQLLIEGKNLEKISELGKCTVDDVKRIIEDCRTIMERHEKTSLKKKIIIRKHKDDTGDDDESLREIFDGAELSAVPLGSSLTMFIDGASKGNPGPAGIGIVINDSDDRQIGKVSAKLGIGTNNYAEYQALIRALRIALYYETKKLRIRTDSELIVRQLDGTYSVKNKSIQKLYETAVDLIRRIPTFKIEHVSRNFNDKADYLAKKATD